MAESEDGFHSETFGAAENVEAAISVATFAVLVKQEMKARRTSDTRNPHCSNCGDTRGGPVGHEVSECNWRSGA